jgi:hypothetical protein
MTAYTTHIDIAADDGIVAGNRVGARLYNAAHTTSPPAILVAIGLWQHASLATALSLIWLAHIGVDRALAYGLKYPDNPQHTHLSTARRSAERTRQDSRLPLLDDSVVPGSRRA